MGKHSGSCKAKITQYVPAILEQIPKHDLNQSANAPLLFWSPSSARFGTPRLKFLNFCRWKKACVYMASQDGVAGGSCLPFPSDLKWLSCHFLWIQLDMNFKQIKHDVPVLHIETFNSTGWSHNLSLRLVSSVRGAVVVPWQL